VRAILLGPATAASDGMSNPVDSRALPMAVLAALVATACLLYRREAPHFAERA